MALPQQLVVPVFMPHDPDDPTVQEINNWVDELNDVITALDNVIRFFRLRTLVIPLMNRIAAAATQAMRVAHVTTLQTLRTQIILFQGMVYNEASDLVARSARPSIKVQRPTFDGKPENARGFLAGISTYRHLRANDFRDDETFITWSLACMEGPQVNPWKNALLNRRATVAATGQPTPTIFTHWVDFLAEFQGKFLDPNEIENAGRALMSLKQIRSAREFSQEYDRLAELAGVSGEDFLLDQFRRNLKPIVQEK